MPTLTVRDIPERLYERLRERAAQTHRSMSGEVVTLLERALLPQPLDTEALIAEAEAADAWFDEPLPDLIAEGKRAGRKYEGDLADNGLPRTEDASPNDTSADELSPDKLSP